MVKKFLKYTAALTLTAAAFGGLGFMLYTLSLLTEGAVAAVALSPLMLVRR